MQSSRFDNSTFCYGCFNQYDSRKALSSHHARNAACVTRHVISLSAKQPSISSVPVKDLAVVSNKGCAVIPAKRKASLLGSDLMDQLRKRRQLEIQLGPVQPANTNEGDTVSNAPQDDSDSHSEGGTSNSNSTLPPEIEGFMFKRPDGFSSEYLYSRVNKPGGIQYQDGMFERMSSEEKTVVDLLHILKGQPLGLFDEIQKWRWRCEIEYKHKVNPKAPLLTRDRTLDHLMDLYGYKNLLPRKLTITLPCTGVTWNFMVFSFGEALTSLLTDPTAMQPENLSFDPANPFKEPKVGGDDGYHGDFNTGSVHRNGWVLYCKKSNSMGCEITLYVNKTHIDHGSRNTLEPLIFTIGIFNSSFRTKSGAWRPLAYLPNMDVLAPHASADDKLQDYLLH